MAIVELFPPVHLYIKIHNETGLKYFGRTVQDPVKYLGSGLVWLNHLRKYGASVSTYVLGTYHDSDSLHRDAREFSEINQIVNSPEWANLVEETGDSGVPSGAKLRRDPVVEAERLRRLAEYWNDPEWRARAVEARSKSWTTLRKEQHGEFLRNHHWTDERRLRQSEAIKKKWVEWRESGINPASKAPKSSTHKSKISASLLGKKKSPQHTQHIQAACKTRRPPKAPKELQHVADGVYLMKGRKITRLKKGAWSVDTEKNIFKTLKAATKYIDEAINNSYLAKQKD